MTELGDAICCAACRLECDWIKADEIIEHDPDGTRRCYVERQLECIGCAEYFGTRRFPVSRTRAEAFRDPEFVRSRMLIVGGGKVPARDIADVVWGKSSLGKAVHRAR